MISLYVYIQSALRKIEIASAKKKGVRLTADEVFALGLSHELSDAFSDYESWEFNEYGELIEDL